MDYKLYNIKGSETSKKMKLNNVKKKGWGNFFFISQGFLMDK